jgi:hypothetical protein
MVLIKYIFNIYFPFFNQNRELNKILKKYDCKTYVEYCVKHPVCGYNNLVKNRFYGVEKNCDYYVRSSGTSSEPKNIPITMDYINKNHLLSSKLALIHMIVKFGCWKMIYGRNLALTGYKYEDKIQKKDVYDISALIFLKRPSFFRNFGFPSKIYGNWEEKLHYFMSYKEFNKVKSISGVPTWMISLFDNIEKSNNQSIKKTFKELSYIIHGGVTFEPYTKIFNEIFNDRRIIFFEIFNSTEGFYAFQHKPDLPYLLLCTNNSIFYEFKKGDKVYQLKEVSVGDEYELIISNTDGLVRYETGDKITFFKRNPCLLTYSGRTSEYLNAFGEDLSIKQSDKIINTINEHFNLDITDYVVIPKYSDLKTLGNHEWFIFSNFRNLNTAEISDFIDENLKEINSNYRQKRYKSLAIMKPSVKILSLDQKEALIRLMKKNIGGQTKLKKLHNNRNIYNFLNKVI